MPSNDEANTENAQARRHCPVPPCCGYCCCPQYFPPKPPKPPKPCPPRPMIPKGKGDKGKNEKKPPCCRCRPKLYINLLGIALLALGVLLVAICVPVWCWPVVIGAALIIAGYLVMRCN